MNANECQLRLIFFPGAFTIGVNKTDPPSLYDITRSDAFEP